MYKDVIIVDKNDQIVGHKPWKEIDWSKDKVRASSVWLEDSRGNVLMQKRGEHMEFNPGKLTFAVGGINDEGDTYESAAVREAKEEIGLDLVDLQELGVIPFYEKKRNGFINYFKAVISGDCPNINFDPNEVAGIEWFSKDELRKLMKENPDMFVDRTLEVPFRLGLL